MSLSLSFSVGMKKGEALTFSSAAGMNWTCLVYGVPMLGVSVWWVVDARKWFKGPKVGFLPPPSLLPNRIPEERRTDSCIGQH